MMPITSVSPAASRNSSRPNCSPFRNCSMTRNMQGDLYQAETKQRQRECAAAFFYWMHDPCQTLKLSADHAPANPRSFHRTFVVEAILVVLDDGGNCLERKLAFGVLDHVLQIKVLDRNVVVAVFERSA